MKVILAEHMGMCFGVRDALQLTRDLAHPEAVTIYGQLVHNPEVLDEMSQRGFSMTPESDRDTTPSSPTVLITAHGISETARKRLLTDGKKLVDTTCPLVKYVHDSATMLQKNGYLVIVIGKKHHIEVRGIVGDLDEYVIVENISEVKHYDADRLGVICQSTVQPSAAARILREIRRQNPRQEVRYIDTICSPTRQRQQAVLDMLGQIEALVVVGGRNSNNTRQLGKLAESRGIPWLHVEGAEDLEPAWFSRFDVVGLTAGTSTLDDTVSAVYRALLSIEGRKKGLLKTAARS